MPPFTQALLAWYAQHGRKGLPWQVQDTWYTRLLSEVMLQQTQVKTVIPYFERFIEAYPTPEALARASDDDVMALWQGLGYYARARNLLKAVRAIVFDREGVCPTTAVDWATLPGIGLSTGGAIAAFSFKDRAVMADGNAKRVIARAFAIEGYTGERRFEKAVWEKAETLLPEAEAMPAYTQALMDMGALVCKRRPLCDVCPLATQCQAHVQGRETDIPAPKPKKTRPVRYAKLVFYFTQTGLFLKKKTEKKGVWQDLFLPPMVESEDAKVCEGWMPPLPEEALIGNPIRLTPHPHDFSHYRLMMNVEAHEVRPETELEGFDFVPFSGLDKVALPAPVALLWRDVERVLNAYWA